MKNLTNQSLLAETDSSLIRAELERLLSNRRFSGARQMSAFLRYIVSETLDGNGNRIKAYTVGVDALGKADDFDAQSDPSVRVLALRLRKSLEAAYADEPECHAVIVMTVGSYVPEFYKPEVLVSIGEAEESLKSGKSEQAGDITIMSGHNSGSSLRNDASDGANSTSRRVSSCEESAGRSLSAANYRAFNRQSGSGQSKVASVVFMPEPISALLRDRWSVIMAVALLAAAWQVSVNTASAENVLGNAVATQTDVESCGQVAQ